MVRKGISFNETVERLTMGYIEPLDGITPKPPKQVKKQEIIYLSADPVNKLLAAPTRNILFEYFARLFTPPVAEKAFRMYHVGSEEINRTIFMQTDINGNYRQAKAMLYQPDGHRYKTHGTGLLGKDILKNQAKLTQCLFGEHLLKGNTKPVAVVESEKTAIGMSLVCPGSLWIATGGKNGLNNAACVTLKDYDIILYPDVDGAVAWQKEASRYGFRCTMIPLDEGKADIWDIASNKRHIDSSTGLLLTDEGYPVLLDLPFIPTDADKRVIAENNMANK